MASRQRKKHSALVFVLKGLIPYSKENLLLSFSPNRFYNELEKVSGHRQATLKNAYWRAKQKGLIEETQKTAELTAKGFKEIRPFMAKRLGKNARLMVIFDIPEQQASKRQQLRNILRQWKFKQIQKSVWVTDLDYKDLLAEVIGELKLSGCVEIYESSRLFPQSHP